MRNRMNCSSAFVCTSPVVCIFIKGKKIIFSFLYLSHVVVDITSASAMLRLSEEKNYLNWEIFISFTSSFFLISTTEHKKNGWENHLIRKKWNECWCNSEINEKIEKFCVCLELVWLKDFEILAVTFKVWIQNFQTQLTIKNNKIFNKTCNSKPKTTVQDFLTINSPQLIHNVHKWNIIFFSCLIA